MLAFTNPLSVTGRGSCRTPLRVEMEEARFPALNVLLRLPPAAPEDKREDEETELRIFFVDTLLLPARFPGIDVLVVVDTRRDGFAVDGPTD